MMPLIAERIYKALTGDRSVHLTDWPDVEAMMEEPRLLEEMDLARDVCSAVLTLREAHRRRTRLPLKTMIVAHPNASVLAPYKAIVAEAVNVKAVELTTDVSRYSRPEIKVNSKLGASIGSKFKEVLAAQRANDWIALPDGRVEIAGVELGSGDFEMRVRTVEGVVAEPIDSWRGLVVLDTTIYAELQAEGWARDFVRLVQAERKAAALNITDRIKVTARTTPQVGRALRARVDFIGKETLAVGVELDLLDDVSEPDGFKKEDIDGSPLSFRIERIAI
jgi:isoleucyl-tRNA synthetase